MKLTAVDLIKLFFNGNLSKPEIEYLLINSNSKNEIYILKALKNHYSFNYMDALKNIEYAIKHTQNNSIAYVLNLIKITVLYYLGKKVDYKEIYERLINDYNAISIELRQYAIIILKILNNAFDTQDIKEIKSRHKNIPEIPYFRPYLSYCEAWKNYKEKNVKEAEFYYLKGINEAKQEESFPVLLNGLNNYIWNILRNKNVKEINLEILYEFEYLIGKYCIYETEMFIYLDTIYEIQKIFSPKRLLNTGYLLNILYSKLSDNKEPFSKSFFKERYKEIKNMKLNHNSYQNTNSIISYIRNLSKSDSMKNSMSATFNNLINKKTSNIRSSTISRIADEFHLDINEKIQYPFSIEIYKNEIKKQFEKNFEFLRTETIEEIKIRFIAGYIGLIEKDELNIKKIILYFENSEFREIKREYGNNVYFQMIVNYMFEKKRDLISGFIEKAESFLGFLSSKDQLENFLSFYLNMKKETQEILNKIILNYERYKAYNNIVKFDNEKRLDNLINRYSFDRSSFYMSFYSLEEPERELIYSVLEKIQIKTACFY